MYDPQKSLQYDYIHGVADLSNDIDSNNMVLGIDEHLPEDRKNKEVEFIAFKKFYQRIYKETGCRYKEWVDEIKAEYKSLYNIDLTEENIVNDIAKKHPCQAP